MKFHGMGMRAPLALGISLLTSLTAKALPPDTLADSRVIIQKGAQRYEDKNYKDAVRLFRQIPEGDTNYRLAQYELALTLLADSAYADAEKVSRAIIDGPEPGNKREIMLLSGHALDYLGRTDEAIAVYDSLIRTNPYDHQPWYEKGTVYLRKKDYARAAECYQRSMTLNPGHFRSHFNLGLCLLQQGRMAESYLALCYSLFMTSDPSLAGSSIALLSAIQSQSDDVVKPYKERNTSLIDPAFDEADAIINAKLALSRDYRFESVLSGDATINTLHAILEKATFEPQDTSFVMQYYMPFYAEVMREKDFDGMMLLMFSGFGIDVVDKQARRAAGEVKRMKEFQNSYADRIASTGEVNYTRRQKAPEKYALVPADGLFVVGGFRSLQPLVYNPGPVEVYSQGNLFGRGMADASGQRTGEWLYYYDNGALRRKENFRAGKQTGHAEYYRKNGTPEFFLEYDAQGNLKERTDFSEYGNLASKSIDNGDHAVITFYHDNGAVNYTTRLKNGKMTEALIRTLHPNGQTNQEIHLDRGERSGMYTEYHDNGQKSEETSYSDGKRTGASTTYFSNGQVHFKMNFRNDKLDGPYEEFDKNGKLVERGEYANGKKTGLQEFFAPDGRSYGSVTYRKDRTESYTFTDPAGKKLMSAEVNDGHLHYVSYNAKGVKTSDVHLRDGDLEGPAVYYHPTGSKSKELTFKESEIEGLSTEYYPNGRKKSEAVFSKGNTAGPYREWASSGVKTEEGYQHYGQRGGLWTEWFPDGKIESETFYVDGKNNGPQKQHYANGSLSYTRYYDRGLLMGLQEYDSTGKEISRAWFPGGNGRYTTHYMNGKVHYEVDLRNGHYEGPYVAYFPDGSVEQKGKFVAGRYEGEHLTYYPNGTLHSRSFYKGGEADGNFTVYDPTGTVENERVFINGMQEKLETTFIAGIRMASYEHENGKLHGRTTYYGDDNQVAGVLVYEDGEVIGYTSMGPDGKELPVTPVLNGTAHVQTNYPNGKKAMDFTKIPGGFSGDFKRWYSSGQLAQSYHYTETGENEGHYERWAPNGKPIYEAWYKGDVMVGVENTWDTNGKLVNVERRCDNGAVHGRQECWNSKTNAMSAVVAYYGEIAGM